MKHLKWPYDKHVDPIQAWGVVSGGLVVAIGIAGILATLDHPDYHWAWPTNWMAIPAAITLIGLVLVVVPWQHAPPVPLPKTSGQGTGSGGYCLSLVRAELSQWQQFAASAAERGWIQFVDEVPPADALSADDGSARQVIAEPLKANLLKVYRYFTAVVAAHEGIESWRKSQQTSTPAVQKRENEGIGDVLASTISTVVVALGLHGGRYAWLTTKLKRAQVKNHEYQARLKALPDILAALRKDIEAVAAGASTDSTAQATPVEVPDVPVIEAGTDGSIDFHLTPIKGYSLGAA